MMGIFFDGGGALIPDYTYTVYVILVEYLHVASGGILGGHPNFPNAYSGLMRNCDLSFLNMEDTAMSRPHITFLIVSSSVLVQKTKKSSF